MKSILNIHTTVALGWLLLLGLYRRSELLTLNVTQNGTAGNQEKSIHLVSGKGVCPVVTEPLN